VEQKDAVSLVLASVPTIKNLHAQQWSTAADMTKTLQPFLAVTELMSGASYPTLSMVLPVVDGLLHLLQSAVGGLDVLRDVLVCQVQERFGNLFDDDDCALPRSSTHDSSLFRLTLMSVGSVPSVRP